MSERLIKLDKKNTFLQIVYYLIMILFLASSYEETSFKGFFYMELVTIYMLFMAVFRYILIYKYKPRRRVKKKIKKQPMTPLDKEFQRNYKKINRNNVYKEPISDAKSEYIQSVWDELKKS